MFEKKLNFVVAGVQKAGTTTFDRILRYHPQLQMASIKETHFFDNDKFDWQNPNYAALERHFPARDERLRGESTPITIFWRPAIRRLHAYNSNVKFILLLRNPIQRAFSNWRHEYASGREKLPFHDAIREKGRSRLRGEEKTSEIHRYFSYVERGFYAEQLTYLIQYFPSRNIHCVIFEEFFSDRAASLQRTAEFLGIEPFPSGIPEIWEYAAKDVHYPSQLNSGDFDYLKSLFAADLESLQAILKRSIHTWTD